LADRFLIACSSALARCHDREAHQFFTALDRYGREHFPPNYSPTGFIDVLPLQRIIYVTIPKCASCTIKMVLCMLLGRRPQAHHLHVRRKSGIPGPCRVGFSTFHRLVRDPTTLRFCFVRNPYALLVSAWANIFQGRLLVGGGEFLSDYLALRREIDPSLPHGPGQTLSFPDFVRYATATVGRRVDVHWQPQADFLALPGLPLDLVGKVESFATDFARVLDHVGAGDPVRRAAGVYVNASPHQATATYYTKALADLVYDTYERDFDLLGYPRALP
jgi:hypothetical protein